MPDCVHCARSIDPGEIVCPHCGGEQPAPWMVNVVYVLSFLFAQGAIYRLIWPNADSLVAWLGWLLASALAAGTALYVYRRFTRGPDIRRPNGGK